ncbi:hypothetical protein [Candidatus Enterococcus clewellii]|uniref:Uncharacterized protein n=1 Tax=Candidatus Enterococcus clewellii TaxID=1834193 RepID=A0A242KC50_9ENTE|nr:hypothetical protein [Enterococcus sp. 9E7_DIV0242]OTP18741.1 hypothetical protein A5888_000555 [Enterococcus sp. 9E7_DIV0242]
MSNKDYFRITDPEKFLASYLLKEIKQSPERILQQIEKEVHLVNTDFWMIRIDEKLELLKAYDQLTEAVKGDKEEKEEEDAEDDIEVSEQPEL